MVTPLRRRLAGALLCAVCLLLYSVCALPGSRGATAEAEQRWLWPVGPEHRVIRAYVAPASPYSAGHRGVDIAAVEAQPVVAAEAGVVWFVGTVVDRPLITLSHPGGLLSTVEPVASDLRIGAAVSRGQNIGTVARGGHCDGRCVHFGVRLRGEYVSPLLLLEGIPRARLLPWRDP